jgi:hypothetical protein
MVGYLSQKSLFFRSLYFDYLFFEVELSENKKYCCEQRKALLRTIPWRTHSRLSWQESLRLVAILFFCHYERSEVIQKQVLFVRRLLLSLRSIAMTRDS